MKRIWEDINFTAICNENPYYMGFKLYQITGMEVSTTDPKKFDIPHYQCKNARTNSDTTTDIEKAQVYVSGGLKWDGCCNFRFDEQENCMLHTCGKKGMTDIGKALERVHDLGSELIQNWDGS